MNKRKPKGRVPSLIGGANGKPKRVAVKRQSKCSRCHAPLEAGKTCIAIPKLGHAYSTAKRVCDECFQRILEKTAKDFEEIGTL